jgi:hypothetical protein
MMQTFNLFKILWAAALLLMMNATAVAEEKPQDLAAQARDPTAPLTAFAIRYDITTSFHNLPDADQQQLTIQPIIPWKWGKYQHISRITLPYVTSAPDWGLIAEDAAGGLPPNYVPTAEQEGLADTALVDVVVFPTSWGRQGFGGALVMPTASDPALGSEKWSVGPAYVAITKIGGFQGGFLTQWLVSIAGESDRDDINSLTLQPFGGFGFSGGWSLNTSEMVFNYDVERSRWTSLPLGVRVEKLVKLGKMSARLFVDVEHNFADKDVAPENIVRFAFVPLF